MDSAVFNQIYDQCYKRVYNYISYRINNHQDIDDIVSQVFLKVLKKHDTYDAQKGTIEVWVIRIARNTLHDYFRQNQKYSTVDIDVFSEEIVDNQFPEEIIVRNEDNRVLMNALNTLDVRERNIIALKYAAELNHKQIANVMDLSVANVGVILFRSLKKLKKILSEEENSCQITKKTGKTI